MRDFMRTTAWFPIWDDHEVNDNWAGRADATGGKVEEPVRIRESGEDHGVRPNTVNNHFSRGFGSEVSFSLGLHREISNANQRSRLKSWKLSRVSFSTVDSFRTLMMVLRESTKKTAFSTNSSSVRI